MRSSGDGANAEFTYTNCVPNVDRANRPPRNAVDAGTARAQPEQGGLVSSIDPGRHRQGARRRHASAHERVCVQLLAQEGDDGLEGLLCVDFELVLPQRRRGAHVAEAHDHCRG
jgi:hypothetical protein